MLKRAVLTWGATLVILALTVSSAWSAPAAQTTPSATPTPVAVDTFDPAAAGGRTVVKWYVGLGTGGDPKQIDVQRKVVDKFNKSQNRIYVALQIVDNRVASHDAGHPDRRGQRARHRRPGRHRRPRHVRRQLSGPGAVHRGQWRRPERVRSGRRQRLQPARPGPDRHAVRRLPVVRVLQQGPVRRGRLALSAAELRRAVPGQASGTSRRSASCPRS